MNSSQIKGALLEYLVRRLFVNCGFSPVKADNLYTFARGGLFFINGRGAAHDADVLMEPPIQIPFAYPTRILYECKAHKKTASLSIVRNALGLREDINEFEVVTKQSLLNRQNNKRAAYAIERRNRYFCQVGVASTARFSKPAVEFATNNKIPLLSLNWFMDPKVIKTFSQIDNSYIDSLDQRLVENIFIYLKDKKLEDRRIEDIEWEFINSDDKIGKIIKSFLEIIDFLHIGLLESGDILFLRAKNRHSIDMLNEYLNPKGKIYCENTTGIDNFIMGEGYKITFYPNPDS